MSYPSTRPAPRPAPPPPPAPRPAAAAPRPAPPRPPLDRLVGKAVRLHLADGSTVTGVLVEAATYELLVRPEAGAPVVVLKAGLLTAQEVEP